MTGVEAIANGVPVFEPPETRNAASTLVIAVTAGCCLLLERRYALFKSLAGR